MPPEDNPADEQQPTEEEWAAYQRSLTVEKTGEIKEGVTPPEGRESPKEKNTAVKSAAAAEDLQTHPTQRLAEAAEKKPG